MESLSSPSRKPKSDPQIAGYLPVMREYLVGILRALIRKIVLAGQDAFAGEAAQRLQQGARLGSGVGVDRFAVVRRGRGRPGRTRHVETAAARRRLLGHGRGRRLREGVLCENRQSHDCQYRYPHVFT